MQRELQPQSREIQMRLPPRPRVFLASVGTIAFVLSGCASSEPGDASAIPTPSADNPTPSSVVATASETAGDAGLVSIGDRSLFLQCEGTGSPVVLFESGLGGDHRTWERILPEIASSTTACTYDRAGIMPSDPAPGARSAATAVDDLDALLAVANVEPPYVLVGFSYGGIISQLFAATFPDDVAGIVLVESNHPREAEQFEAELTPEQIEEDRAFALDNPEHLDVFAGFEEVQEAGALPNVPLVVITAGLSEGWPPGWDPEVFDALRAAQQAELATLTDHGTQVIAERSHHHVPSEQPETIVDAVRDVLDAAS
jgi:pimeloyl-ACP methyl ester carboxylesterase